MVKRIVCLANSRKLSGRCIAGREWTDGKPGAWIRPVSLRPKEELLQFETQCTDGKQPELLDIVEVPLLSHTPRNHQVENWSIDSSRKWKWVDVFRKKQLDQLITSCTKLWPTGYQTSVGLHDRVPLKFMCAVTDSLRLISVEELKIRVCKPGIYHDNPETRVQARFKFGAFDYAIWTTDCDIEDKYLAYPLGEYNLGPCYLTVSLAEPWGGFCYKLVAGVIPK